MCWAKRSLTRLMQGLELCPWFSPDGAGVWSQQGLWDEQPPTVAVFRVLLPPRPGHRFSRSLGPLARVLALVAYASRAEPGSYRGRSRERPQVLDVQAKLCRGSRWALESRLMLSPLPVVVTAQKPSDVGRVPGVSLLGSRQRRAAIIPHSRRALNMAKLPILAS